MDAFTPSSTCTWRIVRARTILQVQVEDGVKASMLFDELMGEEVQPRREFIEKNAKYVKNLDI